MPERCSLAFSWAGFKGWLSLCLIDRFNREFAVVEGFAHAGIAVGGEFLGPPFQEIGDGGERESDVFGELGAAGDIPSGEVVAAADVEGDGVGEHGGFVAVAAGVDPDLMFGPVQVLEGVDAVPPVDHFGGFGVDHDRRHGGAGPDGFGDGGEVGGRNVVPRPQRLVEDQGGDGLGVGHRTTR